MPDSDRFYRGFRGKHWGKTAKCIIEGQDLMSIAEILEKACATTTKEELLAPVIKQIWQFLRSAVLDARYGNGRNSEIRIQFERDLQRLSRSHPTDLQSFLLAKDAATATFAAFTRSSEPCHDQAILDGLCDRFHERIIRGRLFSVMRERAIRDPQFKLDPILEKALLGRTVEKARQWLANVLTGRNQTCRLPPTRRKQGVDINSIDSLNKPLADF